MLRTRQCGLYDGRASSRARKKATGAGVVVPVPGEAWKRNSGAARQRQHRARPDTGLPVSLLTQVTLAVAAGMVVALLMRWGMEQMARLVPAAKAPWYSVRAAGLIAFTLLWLATVWGLVLSTRWAQAWGIARNAAGLHEFFSLLALVFATLHALILHFDRYLQLRWWQVWVPFAATPYRPVALGWGQVAFLLTLATILSFYVRRYVGAKRWRTLHLLTFLAYGLALLHGVTAGTDNPWPPVRLFYLASAGTVLCLTYTRLLIRR